MTTNILRPRTVLVLFAAAFVAAGLLALASAQPARAADRSFAEAENFAVGSTPTTVTSADFDGDGNMDLAAQNSGSNNVSVLMGDGDGAFVRASYFVVGSEPSAVTSADFDGDGKADLAVSNWSSRNVSVLLGNGDGTFQAARNFPAGANPSSVVSADFNADTFADLAVANFSSNNVSILLGQDSNGDGKGDGTFQAAGDFSIDLPCGGFCIPATAAPNQVITADFNGDTRADLATANFGSCAAFCTPGGVSVLLGSGNGSFQDAKLAKSNVTITSIATIAGADIVATEFNSSVVSVLRNNSNGTFSAGPRLPVGSQPSAVTSANLNEDSVTDLAVSNLNSDNVSVLWGDGGSFQAAQNFPAGDGPIFVNSADFGADSFADLAVANQDSNDVSVLLNTPPPLDTDPPVTTHTLSPQPNAAGWNKQSVTLTLSATDDNSGVGQISYSINGGAPSVVEQSSVQIPVTGEGETNISYHATDNAGLAEEPKTVRVKIDRSAPASNATARDSAGNGYASGTWTSKDVTIELSANDGSGSAVKEISYSNNGGANQSYNPTDKIVVSSEGVSTVSYFATDNADNRESPAKTFTVRLDKSAPTLDTDNSDGADGVTPDKGQTGVRRNVNPTATFSDQMDPASLGTSARLDQWNAQQGKWQRVPARVSVAGKTATLDPYPSDSSRLLAANKRFKITITTGAKNLAGLSTASPKSWTFTTGTS